MTPKAKKSTRIKLEKTPITTFEREGPPSLDRSIKVTPKKNKHDFHKVLANMTKKENKGKGRGVTLKKKVI